jgi:membrane fusion protein (multidrug efflux system)
MNAERKISVGSATDGDAPPREKKGLRRVLMVFVPLVVVVAGGLAYGWGGRYAETDNAYIKADIASISPEVSGNITQILVAENAHVTKGQPLAIVDDTTYRIALAGSEAQLRSAVASIESAKARYHEKDQSIALNQTDLAFAQRDLQRQTALAAQDFATKAKLDEAKHAVETAQRNIALTKQEQKEILASLEGNPDIAPEQHPTYQLAMASKVSAQTFIARTTVRAPFDGVVSQVPKVGDYARTGAPLLSLVSTAGVWVEANFKETDLTHMTMSQPTEIRVDTYPGVAFEGHVESISQATGAEFAVLPAQNSTGNWVKVVQRVPVRIAVDKKDGPPLRAGMSVVASVDTGKRRYQEWFGK